MIKSIVGILFGVGGVVSSTPIAYVMTSSPFHKTFWRKTLNNTAPVFSCDNDAGRYEVILSKIEDESEALEKDLGYTARVLIRWKTWAWGDIKFDREKRDHDLMKKMGYQMRDLEGGRIWERVAPANNWKVAETEREKHVRRCDQKDHSIIDRIMEPDGVKNSRVKLVTQNCKNQLFTITCNVTIGSGNVSLDWDVEGTPTITYWAF